MIKENLQGLQTITDPETGRTYFVPAGGSGTEQAVTDALAGGTEEEEEEETSSENEEVDDDDDEDENFNSETFLQSIEDEELRKQLEPHVKRWDAGVTRRFQELHSRLRPYQDLGEYETLAEAQQLYQILNESPERLYNALAQSLGRENVQQGQPGPQGRSPQGQNPQQQRGQQAQGSVDGMTQQQYAQLPPDIQRQLQQQSQIVETLAQAYLGQEKSRQQQQEDEALDSYLNNLKDEFGDFDEHYVLSKMASGTDGAKAVRQYRKTIENELARRQSSQAPKLVSGGGQVPQESVNVAEMDTKDVKSMVAGLMSQSAQAGE